MNVSRSSLVAAMFIVAGAVCAAAQTPYVGASLTGDIVRTTHTETVGFDAGNSGGEALGFALRVGTHVGAAWGVEAEFARPSEIRNARLPEVYPLAATSGMYEIVPSSLLIYPTPRFETRERNTTLSAVAWVEQRFTSRMSLVYLGGLGFYRSERDTEVNYPPILATAVPFPIPIRMYRTETTVYGMRPLAGVESRIGLTAHVQLTPGIRLHAMDNAWIVRPAVGLLWMF